MKEKPTIGVFRLQLFKTSEGFISEQARTCTRYKTTFIGRKIFGPVLPNSEIILPNNENLLNHLLIAGLRYNQPFLDSLAGKNIRPDLIHAHFAVDGVYALKLAKALNVPLITTLHGFDVSRRDASLLRSLKPALVNSVLYRQSLIEGGDLFICVSEFIRRAALKKGFPAEKLKVHYIGIDTDTLIPDPGPKEPTTILHVARLVEKKGTDYLLEAGIILKKHIPDLKIKIIGDGILRDVLRLKAKKLGDTVEFLGALPNKETLSHMKSCSVVAVPSVTALSGDSEGLPIVTLEAAALGIPVVATDSGGISEAIIDGETGYIVPERNVEALSERLGRILTNPNEARSMGALARHHVEKNFNIVLQTQKLEEIYDGVLERVVPSH